MTATHAPALTPSTPLVWLMAVACGLSVGGLYYAQPLWDLLSRTLHVSSAGASTIITVTQLGFVGGLVFLIPLGDFFNRRWLVPLVCIGATLPFLLAPSPYGYSETTIGLFSLLGAAGAIGASLAGRLHDDGRGQFGTAGFIVCALMAFIIMGLAPHQLAAIVIGILLMDLGVQGVQILNQSTIYTLRPEARSRITTAYMGCFFLGGAAGSLIAGIAYDLAGWPGAMAVASVLEATALAFWCNERSAGRVVEASD